MEGASWGGGQSDKQTIKRWNQEERRNGWNVRKVITGEYKDLVFQNFCDSSICNTTNC